MKEIKVSIHNKIKLSIESKLASYQTMLDSINESKNNETKSSAGDKFKTGRAMMQAEQDKVAGQLDIASYQLSVLNNMDLTKSSKSIALGSLVMSSSMNYYLSISYGKVVVGDKKIYAISLVSPIGKLLLGKTTGDEVSFNGRSIKVLDVI